MINVNHIRYITFNKPNKHNEYKIDLAANWFKGFLMLGSGSVSCENYEVTVCEKEHPEDYKIVTEWINKNSEL
jgi:hypothetical protein